MKSFTCLLTITTIFTLMSTCAHAQNCAAQTKQDPFTNIKIVESDEVKVYGAPLDQYDRGYLLSFQLRKDTIYICFQTKGRFMVPSAFTKVMVKLADNSILTFNSFVEAGPVDEPYDYEIDKSYCQIDKQTLIKLSSSPITNLHFDLGPPKPNRVPNALTLAAANQQQQNSFGGDDNTLGSGKAKKVMKSASCMLLYLP